MRSVRHEIAVLGAGPAGTVAALAAARDGRDVLLIEKLPFLGGTATAAMVAPWMAFHAEGKQIVAGLAQQIVDRLMARGGCSGHIPDPLGVAGSLTPFDTELLKLLLFELAREHGVKLALHSFATGVERGPSGEVRAVTLADKSGGARVEAGVWIDASGDADLATWCGVPTRSGRDTDGLTQPLTAIFKVGGVDEDAIRSYVREHPSEFVLAIPPARLGYLAISGFFAQVRAARESGELTLARDRVLFFGLPRPGEVAVNMTRIQGRKAQDAADLSLAEAEAAAQVQQAFDFLRRRIPGFASSHLLQVPVQAGIRESRRIVGRHVLTREDVISGARFEDAIALGGFPIDIHAPAGAGVDCPQAAARAYQIPLRSLLTHEVPNLLVAGRCLSATFEAHASARITPSCMAMGEAAGIAASLMLRHSAPAHETPLAELQRTLRAHGALLEPR